MMSCFNNYKNPESVSRLRHTALFKLTTEVFPLANRPELAHHTAELRQVHQSGTMDGAF